MRSTLSVLSLIACVQLSLAGSPTAKDRGLTMEVEHPFGQWFKPGRWMPIAVTLRSEERPFEGSVAVVCGDAFVRDIGYCRQVKLPGKARMRLWLYGRGEGYKESVFVRLRDSEEREVQRKEVRLAATPSILIASVRAGWPAPTALLDERAATCRIEPELVPDKWYGLSPADLLVTSVGALRALREKQLEAVVRWVGAGGHLVVKLDWQGRYACPEALTKLLEVTVTGSAELRELGAAPGFGALPEAAGQLAVCKVQADRYEVLLGTREAPLIARRRFGCGCVTLVTFDFDRLASTPAHQVVWSKLLEVKAASHEEVAELLNADQLGIYFPDADRARSSLPAPLIFGLVLLYTLLVGPLEYVILKSINRLEWTWCTFLCTSVICAAASFLGVRHLRMGSFLVTQHTALYQTPGSEMIRGLSFVDVYSQKNARYTLRPAEVDGCLDSLTFLSTAGKFVWSGDEPEYWVDHSDGFTLRSYWMPIWSHSQFLADWVRPGALLEVTWQQEGEKIIIQGRNRLDQYVERPSLAIGNSLYRFNDIGPRQEFRLSASRARSRPAPLRGSDEAWMFAAGWRTRKATPDDLMIFAEDALKVLHPHLAPRARPLFTGALTASPFRLDVEGYETDVAEETIIVIPHVPAADGK